MTKLLVSVRNAAEAQAALDAGAHLIDVKEPHRGALGMAEVETLDAIATAIDGQAPLSAALGELHERNRLPESLAGRVTFAKFGLAGAAQSANWQDELQQAVANLPAGTIPIGVAYADWPVAQAPSPAEVLSTIVDAGYGGLLVDTFDKSSGGLLSHLPLDEVRELTVRARSADLRIVLAGKLGREDFPALLALEPDYLGVRGAVCRGSRQAGLDADLVRQFVSLVGSKRPPLRRPRGELQRANLLDNH